MCFSLRKESRCLAMAGLLVDILFFHCTMGVKKKRSESNNNAAEVREEDRAKPAEEEIRKGSRKWYNNEGSVELKSLKLCDEV